jgi:hypothetical protein
VNKFNENVWKREAKNRKIDYFLIFTIAILLSIFCFPLSSVSYLITLLSFPSSHIIISREGKHARRNSRPPGATHLTDMKGLAGFDWGRAYHRSTDFQPQNVPALVRKL